MSGDKDKIVEQIRKGIDEASRRMSEMKEEMGQQTTDVKMKLDSALEELEHQRKQLVKQLDQISSSSGAAADAMVKGFGEAWGVFAKSLQEASDAFQGKNEKGDGE